MPQRRPDSSNQERSVQVGDKVEFKLSPKSDPQPVTVTYVGRYSVRVEDDLGRTLTFKKSSFLNQLYGWPKRRKLTKKQRQARQREFEERVISTPTGGQPGYRR
jgi:hypothetical protein